MDHEPRPWRLKELTPAAVQARLRHRAAMIVPVGSTEPHGAHLPLGCDTMIVERLADDLSARFGVLVAPPVEYGVNPVVGVPLPGGAPLRRKTLHRVMNELIESWEIGAGVRDFIILTAEGHESHQEALSTILVTEARVQVVDIFAMELGDLLERPGGPVHGGELDTSLLLYIAPHLVQLASAVDTELPAGAERYQRGGRLSYARGPSGSLGYPSRATIAKGEALYNFILDRVATRCFPPEDVCA